MNFLELINVSKSYGQGRERTEVLKDINLKVDEGEFVAIIGFSGSGKTTLMSLIGGLIPADDGVILLKGEHIVSPGPDRGMVFQNYSLLPWLNVYENIALAVDHLFPRWTDKERRAHIEKYIEMVHLTPARNKRPAELSGGMRQRVSVARALAMNPKILLLDEPLSALDALTRATLQREIEKIWSQNRKTVVLITNDVDEGLLLADRIIPLTPGPGATLGPVFPVNFKRPRDRVLMNHNPEYKKLRNTIINYLMDVGSKRNIDPDQNRWALPNLQPLTIVPRRTQLFNLRFSKN